MKRLVIALALALAILVPATEAPRAIAVAPRPPHVFVIVLENKTYETTFADDSPAPYLAHTLPSMGVLLRQYHGIGHFSLDNYIAMISGQAPNPATQGDCQVYADFVETTPGALDGDGQARGDGCVYPKHVLTLADQLDSAGLSWKGYMSGIHTPCRHPDLGTRDETQSAKTGEGGQYAARHNPFVYFHSIIDDGDRCAAHVRDLGELTGDLASESTTPSFSFITPDLCEDGHDAPCVDGRPGGLETADVFLRTWVPQITSSAAFRDGGILVVTFDEAEAASENQDARSCCRQPNGPNTPQSGMTGTGGGRTGAVVLSPSVIPGSVSDEPYNHYSLLRSLEDLFGLTHLGYAGRSGLRPFGADVFPNGA